MKNRLIIIVGIFLLFLISLQAEDIALRQIKKIPSSIIHKSFISDNRLFIFGTNYRKDWSSTSDLFIYDTTKKDSHFAGFEGLTELAGPIGDKVLVVVLNPIRSYLYDIPTGTYEPFSIGDRYIEENGNHEFNPVPVKSLLPYQNNRYFIQMQRFRFIERDPGVLWSKIGILDVVSGQFEEYPFQGVMHAISPDKEYLLIDEDESPETFGNNDLEYRDFIICRIDTTEKEIGYGVPFHKGGDPGDDDWGGIFVGNENILVPTGTEDGFNYFLQRLGEPENAVKLNITVRGEPVTVRLSSDFTWGFCKKREGNESQRGGFIVDATPPSATG